MGLAVPVWCEQISTGKQGLAVSETLLNVQYTDGTVQALMHWCVLFDGDGKQTPEYIPITDIEWLSVPGITEDADSDEEESDSEEFEEEEETPELS